MAAEVSVAEMPCFSHSSGIRTEALRPLWASLWCLVLYLYLGPRPGGVQHLGTEVWPPPAAASKARHAVVLPARAGGGAGAPVGALPLTAVAAACFQIAYVLVFFTTFSNL